MTKYNGTRFEFVFTNLVKDSPRLFTTMQVRQGRMVGLDHHHIIDQAGLGRIDTLVKPCL